MTEDESRKLTEIDRRVAALETQDALMNLTQQTVERRLHAIEDTLKWLVRLIIGAIILAFVGFVVSGGFSPGGIPSV